jgi:hypothetical protein
MGNLSFRITFTSVCLGVSSIILCGISFLARFYSKDVILETVTFSYVNLIGFVLFFFCCFYWLNCLLFVSLILCVLFYFIIFYFYYVFVVIVICLLFILLVRIILIYYVVCWVENCSRFWWENIEINNFSYSIYNLASSLFKVFYYSC